MQSETRVYRFGPFALGADRRRLTRQGQPVWIRPQSFDVLLVLVSNAGHVVTKDALADAVWAGMSVSDNSIDKAVSTIRQALGSQPDGTPYVETRRGKGFVFAAPVTSASAPPPKAAASGREAPAAVGAVPAAAHDEASLLAPYRAFIDGRAALETLDRDEVSRARQAFEHALVLEPAFAGAHIGMANARLLAFEMTRADVEVDRAALADAERHARDACRLDPASGDAWSTLAVALDRGGNRREAIAAARKAVALEPQEWRHHLRLAAVSWGAERLRAAHRMLLLCPGLALGHWFAATVFVARGAFDLALEYLRAGCAARETQPLDGRRFTAVALHYVHGLVLAAQGATDAAREALHRELALLDPGHVYARECRANTCYALGALALREGRHLEARAGFEEALVLVPAHRLAAVGLAAVPASTTAARSMAFLTLPATPGVSAVDAAVVHAAALALQGRHADAARLVGDALLAGEPDSAGWFLPVEPLLHVGARADVWERPLAALAARAV